MKKSTDLWSGFLFTLTYQAKIKRQIRNIYMSLHNLEMLKNVVHINDITEFLIIGKEIIKSVVPSADPKCQSSHFQFGIQKRFITMK